MTHSDNEQGERSMKRELLRFLVKFALVALFVILVLWLYPFPQQQNLNLKTFYDDVFNRNIMNMRNAAVNWFTVERLPQDGRTARMTLQEMMDRKLILPFTDREGYHCDPIASYVEVSRHNNDWLFRINLSCPKTNQEDYILEYRGCYDFCETDKCITEPAANNRVPGNNQGGKGDPGPGTPRPPSGGGKGTPPCQTCPECPECPRPPKPERPDRPRPPKEPRPPRPPRPPKPPKPERPQRPRPTINTQVFSCVDNNTEFGSGRITVTRGNNDAEFTYTIRVRQPGGLVFTTAASGVLNSEQPSFTLDIMGQAEGLLEFQVLINGRMFQEGTLAFDHCQEAEEPRPNIDIYRNRCVPGIDQFDSVAISILMRDQDPTFTYTIQVRQPGAMTFTTVSSGTLGNDNRSVSVLVPGTSAGIMHYRILINNRVFSEGTQVIEECVEQPKIFEYLHRRTFTETYWTSWSNWSTERVTSSNTRQVQTVTYTRGSKWIPALTYEFRHQRTVHDGYTAWSAWGAWGSSCPTTTDLRDVQRRTVTRQVQTGTQTVFGPWQRQNRVALRTKFANDFNTGNAATATEWRRFIGPEIRRICGEPCRNETWYVFEIWTRTRTTVPVFTTRQDVECRVRTRTARTRNESIWSNSTSVPGWQPTGEKRISGDNGRWSVSTWLRTEDWNTLERAGYTASERRVLYSFRELRTLTRHEYRWFDRDNVAGWTFTGTRREVPNLN